jgi:hypothetical protein
MGMSPDICRLVSDVRTLGDAFRELFALLAEKHAPDTCADALGLVLCDRLEHLGEHLEAVLLSSPQPR